MTSGRPTKPPENRSMLHFMLAGVWEMLWNGKFPFHDTETVKWDRGPTGYAARVAAPTAGAKGVSTPSSLEPMFITQLGSSLTPPNPDLLICRPSGGEKVIYVAKDYEARQPAKEFYYDNGENVTVNYTYFTGTQNDGSYGDNFRLASDGTNTELQVMEKRYYTEGMMIGQNMPLTQAFIYAIDTGNTTGVKDPSGNDVTNIEVKPVRVWVRYATQ